MQRGYDIQKPNSQNQVGRVVRQLADMHKQTVPPMMLLVSFMATDVSYFHQQTARMHPSWSTPVYVPAPDYLLLWLAGP